MPKAGANIYKRKDGRWEGRYKKGLKENGRIAYGYVYAKSCSEAKKKLAEAAVLPKPIQSHNRSRFTFRSVAEQWKFNVSLKAKRSTYAHYNSVLDNHILPELGGLPLLQITTERIDKFTIDMLQHGRKDGVGGLSPKTMCDQLTIVKSVFNFAKNEGLIDSIPTITYPKCKKEGIRVFSKKEQAAIEQVLLDEMDITKLGVMLCLYTGLRLGEVCALQWKDISLSQRKVCVRQTMQRIQAPTNTDATRTILTIDTPKSDNSERELPLPHFLVAILAKYRRADDDFFLSSGCSSYIEPRTMQYRFKKYISQVGVASANYHALRHTFATRCIEAGVDIKSLSEMLGHSTVNITLNRYVHSSFEQKLEGIKKLEQYSSASSWAFANI